VSNLRQAFLDFIGDESKWSYILDNAYKDVANNIRSQFLDAYASGQNLEGDVWHSQVESTIRWRRHYIGKGSYERVGQQVSIESTDEDELLVLSGKTRDDIASNIYYDITSGNIILPDMTNYAKHLTGETSIIIRNLETYDYKVLVDNQDIFISEWKAESDFITTVIDKIMLEFEKYFEENREFYQ
tara:strand:+ start:2954 stop:3511 length:558 start_codon:yes stop_codon:yes gene_type:complete